VRYHDVGIEAGREAALALVQVEFMIGRALISVERITAMSASKPGARRPLRLCRLASAAGRSAHQATVLSSGTPRFSIPVTSAGRLYCSPAAHEAWESDGGSTE
jgi:hypothetical protein